MNKQYLMVSLGILTTGIFAYSLYLTRPEAEVTKENFNELALQSRKQMANIAENGKMVRQLLDKITELQQSNSLSISSEKPKQVVNSKLDIKLNKLSIDMGMLKQQINDLKESKPSVALNLPTATAESAVDDFEKMKQTRTEQKRIEVEKMESTYEAALYEGEEDNNWTSNMEVKITSLINEKKIGDNVQLKNIECRTNLCKINILQSDQSSLNNEELMPAFGNVSVYINRTESNVQGQQGYVMYISKEGENLPPILRN